MSSQAGTKVGLVKIAGRSQLTPDETIASLKLAGLDQSDALYAMTRARRNGIYREPGVIEVKAAGLGYFLVRNLRDTSKDGRCKASGRYHRYNDVPRYTTSDGALLTLGGYVQCSHCHQVTHYSDLRADYQETLCRHAARTHQGNLSEPFALYALEALDVRHPETNMRVRVAEQLGRQVFRAGLFTVTVQYRGNDPEAGPVFTVVANPRSAGDPE